ncbi:probable disease resistance protein At4g27220 [Mangifera indica]|uniref:probable disease resistance protein At4g27220 n=1 Tax=Mangifera indica TaxID=29780 RepID=UPI001CFB3CBA|nr:probable disease resistance protein At4g27220 [Mangifera indica]
MQKVEDEAISCASKLLEPVLEPVVEEIRHAVQYRKRVKGLEEELAKLKKEKEDVESSVKEGEEKFGYLERKKHVGTWISEANAFIEKEEKSVKDEAEKGCFIGFFRNLLRCNKVSKEAETAKLAGEHLVQQKVNFEHLYLQRRDLDMSRSLHDTNYKAFDSRKSVEEKIIKALKDGNVYVIGVHGIAGVGKTTLVEKVASVAMEDKLFDAAVMVEVTKSLKNVERIQEEIARQLGWQLTETDVKERAARLLDSLKRQTRRILVILDHVWVTTNLNVIGIPLGFEAKAVNESGRLKILLISRSKEVVGNYADPENNFPVQALSFPESKNLFESIVGDLTISDLAGEIVKRCAGLPLAIKAIGNAVKQNKNISFWQNILEDLKNFKGVDNEVQHILKRSYEFVGNEDAKSLFLLCAVCTSAGDKISTDYLFKIGTGLGLFRDAFTLKRARNTVLSLIDNLRAACLLLDTGVDDRYVKMSHTMHSVAVSIAEAKGKINVSIPKGANSKEVLESKMSEDLTYLSLINGDINELPERLECPSLKLLLLLSKDKDEDENKDGFLNIPNNFFHETKALKVLYLGGVNIPSEPSLLSCLKKLRTLCLKRCRLNDIGIIGELKELMILKFSYCDFEVLPGEIGDLSKLKSLDLSNCPKLKQIKPNVISRLTRLEELFVANSFNQWQGEGDCNQQGSNASLAELKKLPLLYGLYIHIPNAKIMPRNLFDPEKLERYKILIGEKWEWYGKCTTARTLKLSNGHSFLGTSGIDILFDKVEDLNLDQLSGVEDIVDALHSEKGFPELKYLSVRNSRDLFYIFNTEKAHCHTAFPVLESLFLHRLMKLKKICEGRLYADSFSKLSTIIIKRCHELEHVFSISMAKNLSHLRELEVTDCKKLREIFGDKEIEESTDHDDQKIVLPKLLRLTVKECHALKFMFPSTVVEFPSLNAIHIEGCQSLKTFFSRKEDEEMNSENDTTVLHPLFDEKVHCPSLEKMILLHLDSIQFIWHNNLHVGSFCKLKVLRVEFCGKLTSFVPPDALTRLSNNPQRLQTFQNLEIVRVTKCQSMKNLVPVSIAVGLWKLKEIEIISSGLEEIVSMEEVEAAPKFAFPQLNSLELVDLRKLKSFYPGSHTTESPLLKCLVVYDCPELHTQSENLTQHPLFSPGKVCNFDFRDFIAFLCFVCGI